MVVSPNFADAADGQSQSFPVPVMARYIGIEPSDLVLVAEYCGGGFGSKGAGYPLMSVPAHMARKTGLETQIQANPDSRTGRWESRRVLVLRIQRIVDRAPERAICRGLVPHRRCDEGIT